MGEGSTAHKWATLSAWGYLLSLPGPGSLGQKSEEAGSGSLEEDRGRRLPGAADLGSALWDPSSRGVGTRMHRATWAKDPHRLKNDITQLQGEEMQVGGRVTAPLRMARRALHSPQQPSAHLPPTRHCTRPLHVFFDFLNILLK